MADEIIDVDTHALAPGSDVKDQYGYTKVQRDYALHMLLPSSHDVSLGPGWDDAVELGQSDTSTSSPSSASLGESDPASDAPDSRTSPITPESTEQSRLSEALLVRSCSQGWGLSFELHPAYPTPKLSKSTQVLVENVAVGLNPVDWKSVSYNFGIAGFPWVLGRDIAGRVLAVGQDVEGMQVGDRIWTCADSRDSDAGGYQRFSMHNAKTVARVPNHVTDEQAATLGTGLVTAAVLLYCCFNLPLPSLNTLGKAERDHHARILSSRATKKRRTDTTSKRTASESQICHEDSRYVLIYGGGAITGIYAAQLASLGGLKVICVASPSNFDYLASLGVTACVDRNMKEDIILSRISRIVNEGSGTLAYAIDCVSSSTANVCWRALSLDRTPVAKGEMVCLAGNPSADFLASQPSDLQDNVQVHKISFSTTFYNPSLPFAQNMLRSMTALLQAGTLQPCRPEIVPDGLAGIRHGLEQLRDGLAPRARKLVVRIKDTPSPDITLLGVRSELGWNGAV